MQKEIIVDNFAGGGGASTGIELATGRSVDIAINHDPEAIRMHMVNHPSTEHYCENVWDVDPVKACRGRPVGIAWFSPDCKHFSKAKGSKPVEKKIRDLAWITIKWGIAVRPRIMFLENVEEFKTWGPLDEDSMPIKEKSGETFKAFISVLTTGIKIDNPAINEIRNYLGEYFDENQIMNGLGYDVEYKELIAADYGTPTKRKRLFIVARCDGRPIAWPKKTHADRHSIEVKQGESEPYVPAYKIIDWSILGKSIFERKKPLADNTMKRIARGLKKFVIDNHEPFIIPIGYGENKNQKPRVNDINDPLGTIVSSQKHYLCTPYITQIGQTGYTDDRSKSIEDPLTTIVSKNEHCVIAPTLIQYHSETNDNVRGQAVDNPLTTIDGSNRYALISAFIHQYFDGGYKTAGIDLRNPLPTITSIDHNSLCEVVLSGEIKDYSDKVKAFLIKYYGADIGQDLQDPLGTITTRDRFGLVTIKGIDYQIVDITLRMLEPHELYAAQGFPTKYIFQHDIDGNAISKSEQVKKCGNAVCPPQAKALVVANAPELCMG